MIVLGIDPSIRNGKCGYGFIYRNGRGDMIILDSGVIRVKSNELLTGRKYWPERCEVLTEAIVNMIDDKKTETGDELDVVCIELPQLFVGSKRGEEGLRSESVQKLYYFVGMLAGKLRAEQETVVLYRPSQWKGNLSKEITIRRINRVFHKSLSDNNITDALGIALYHMKKN